MRGRHAPGPEIVARLEGDAAAKRRLEVILQSLSGALRVQEAAAILELTTQRLHTLRQRALQAAVEALTPRPGGRPRKRRTPEHELIDELHQEVERLRRELAASQLREEIALVLPDRPRRLEKKRRTGGRASRGPGR
jgi:hypothetical protein